MRYLTLYSFTFFMSTSALVSDSSSVPSPTMELRITWNTNRVLRPARRGLKAVLCQNRVREDNADEPQAAEPDLLRQRTGHLDLVRSRPRAMPTEFPSREGHRATRVSRTARASAGTRAVEQWNALSGLCRPRHERRTRIPLELPEN